MLARLPRPAAWLMLAALLLAAAWCLGVTPPPVKIAPKGGYTDFMLYRDIAAAVVRGEPYHQAAAELHRLHGYPTRPYFTVRLPTLAEGVGLIGWSGLHAFSVALLIANIFAWFVAFEGRLPLIERIGIALSVALGGAMAFDPTLTPLHDRWAGLLLSLALVVLFRCPRWWPAAVVFAGAALAIRELALPFVLLALACALLRRRWSEAAAWGGLLGAFGLLLAWHAQALAPHTLASDRSSQGWIGLAGPAGFLRAVIFTTPLQTLPLGVARLLALLPALGWLALDGRGARLAVLYLAGFALFIALFGRADTFYWGATVNPAYFVGLALVPRALSQLATRARGRPEAALASPRARL